MLQRERGFSLMEVMLTVSLVAIVGGFAVPTYVKSVEDQRRETATAHLREIRNAQEIYFLRNRQFTNSLGALGVPAPTASDFVYTIESTSADNFVIQAMRGNNAYGMRIDRNGVITQIANSSTSPSQTPTNPPTTPPTTPPPAPNCPTGYVVDPNTNTCVPSGGAGGVPNAPQPTDNSTTCSDGSAPLPDGSCASANDPTSCQSGYVYDAASGTCVLDTSGTPAPSPDPTNCPSGYVYDQSSATCVPDPGSGGPGGGANMPPAPGSGGDPTACPSGYVWDASSATCVPDPASTSCSKGYVWDPALGMCVPDGGAGGTPGSTQPGSCPTGYVWDEASATCVPDSRGGGGPGGTPNSGDII